VAPDGAKPRQEVQVQDKRQAIGLFRYSLIRELADPRLSPRRRGEMIRALAEVDHALADGRRVKVAAVTLRRWLRRWRQGGYEALVPSVRRQPNRIPAEVLEAAVTLKREAPGRTGAQVARVLAEAGRGKIAERTLQRHFARLGLNVRPDGSVPRALGRFQAQEFGELWTGDGLYGPVVGGAKAVLLAFIDDWSRAVPGWRWGYAEDTVRLEAALRRGLESAGVPDAVFVDHGSAFTSAPFHRTLAVLGIRIVHSKVGHAPSRGKIERFFGTVRSQFLVELAARGGAQDLGELNSLFGAWLEGVYHRTPHSETDQTPLERRLAGRQLRRPAPAELRQAFLWAEKRLVSKTASVSLLGNQYEVDPALVGIRVELLFDPFDLTEIEVSYQGRSMGAALPMVIGRHVHPAAGRPVAPSLKGSGIDYLGLVSQRLDREERSRVGIAYAKLPAPTEEKIP
jgi:putative transposase